MGRRMVTVSLFGGAGDGTSWIIPRRDLDHWFRFPVPRDITDALLPTGTNWDDPSLEIQLYRWDGTTDRGGCYRMRWSP